jgi:hypothetical protein
VAAEGLGPWLRSSILAIGQGRAGKTALTRNIAGQEFKDTLSTTGIEELSVGVQYANVKTNSNTNNVNNNNNININNNNNTDDNNISVSGDYNNNYGMWGLCEFTEGQELEAGIAMAAKKAMAANKSETVKVKDKDNINDKDKDKDKVANSNISKESFSANKGNTVINNSPRQSSSASASSFFVPSSIESNANNNVSSSNSTNVSIYKIEYILTIFFFDTNELIIYEINNLSLLLYFI